MGTNTGYELVVTAYALQQMKEVFKCKQDVIDILERLQRAWECRYTLSGRKYICRIAQTRGDWFRYRDYDTNTRLPFSVNTRDRVITVEGIFKRSNETYDLIEALWRATLE